MDETLLRFLDGEMDEREREELEVRLAEDPLLAEKLENLKISRLAIEQWGTATTIRSLHQSMMQEVTTASGRTPVRRIFHIIMRAVAILALLLVSIYFFRSNSIGVDEIYQENFVDYQVSANRGETELSEISSLYQSGEYGSVIKSGTSATGAEDSLLVALSLMHKNDFQSATTWLEPLSAHPRFLKDAEFYLSLVYLKLGKYLESYQLMEQIQKNRNHPYHERISEKDLRNVEDLK